MRWSEIVGWMAERSKALVLGTSLLGGVGSNPTPITYILFFFGLVKLEIKCFYFVIPNTFVAAAQHPQRIGAAEAR